MGTIEENYAGLIRRLGTPLSPSPMPVEELKYCEGRLPPRLIQLIAELGHSTFLNGGVTIARPSTLAPILALVFKADPELSHHDCTVVSYSAFGDLSLWSQELGKVTISLAEGTVSSNRLAPMQFRPGLLPPASGKPADPNLVAWSSVLYRAESIDFLDYAGQPMLARCISMHGPIALGECYGFFPALALAGVESPMRRVENIRRVPALEHFAFLAQAQPFYLTKVGPTGIEKVREIG